MTTRRGRGGGTFIQTGAGPGSDEMIKRTLGPAWEELTELLDYRRLIEQQIARTAAERRSADDIETIRRAVGAYAHAGRPGRLPAGGPRAASGDRPRHA